MIAARLDSGLRRVVPWAALAALLLWSPSALSPDHSSDDADPEVLNLAWRLARGEPLYGEVGSPPWVVNPYTPLYLFLVSLGLKLTGLSYLPARFVSLAATLAVVIALAMVSRQVTGSIRAGLWAACLLTLVPAVLLNEARPHPQMLAVALSLWSFVAFSSRRTLPSEVVSPWLAVLAIYTKQTQVTLPVAMLIWLAGHDRRRMGRYAGWLALFGLLPLFALQSATNGQFLHSILAMNLIGYEPGQILPLLVDQAGALFPFIALALVRLGQRWQNGQLEPVDFYFGALTLTTVASLGRPGAYSQYVVEWLWITALYLLWTGGLRFGSGREALGALQLALVICYGLGFMVFYLVPREQASLRAARPVRELLMTEPGPMISEQGSFSLFTRGEIHLQLFHFIALSRRGLWDPAPLFREVEEHQLAWVVTKFSLEESAGEGDDQARFPPELVQALRRNYVRRAQIGPYFLYRPRTP
ncbi:MAG: hypothetical protein AMXMBFR33_16940 [Candidatus Xenobia bacterium]